MKELISYYITTEIIKSHHENSTQGTKREPNWFSHLNSSSLLTKVFTPSFGFALPATPLLLIFFINSS